MIEAYVRRDGDMVYAGESTPEGEVTDRGEISGIVTVAADLEDRTVDEVIEIHDGPHLIAVDKRDREEVEMSEMGIDFRTANQAYLRKLEQSRGVPPEWADSKGIHKDYPDKYDPEWFEAPEDVSSNAETALNFREETGNPNDCGTLDGWNRAHQLKDQEQVSVETINRIVSFLSRHLAQVDGDLSEEPREDCQRMMILAWGGEEGLRWAEDVQERIKNADEAEKSMTMKAIEGENWVPYQGPQGGSGWQRLSDGEINYDDEPPGQQATLTDLMEGADVDRETQARVGMHGRDVEDDTAGLVEAEDVEEVVLEGIVSHIQQNSDLSVDDLTGREFEAIAVNYQQTLQDEFDLVERLNTGDVVEVEETVGTGTTEIEVTGEIENFGPSGEVVQIDGERYEVDSIKNVLDHDPAGQEVTIGDLTRIQTVDDTGEVDVVDMEVESIEGDTVYASPPDSEETVEYDKSDVVSVVEDRSPRFGSRNENPATADMSNVQEAFGRADRVVSARDYGISTGNTTGDKMQVLDMPNGDTIFATPVDAYDDPGTHVVRSVETAIDNNLNGPKIVNSLGGNAAETEVVEDNMGREYIAKAGVEGEMVQDIFKRNGQLEDEWEDRFSNEELTEIVEELEWTLAAAYFSGNGDTHGANMMIDPDSLKAYLIDFDSGGKPRTPIRPGPAGPGVWDKISEIREEIANGNIDLPDGVKPEYISWIMSDVASERDDVKEYEEDLLKSVQVIEISSAVKGE